MSAAVSQLTLFNPSQLLLAPGVVAFTRL